MENLALGLRGSGVGLDGGVEGGVSGISNTVCAVVAGSSAFWSGSSSSRFFTRNFILTRRLFDWEVKVSNCETIVSSKGVGVKYNKSINSHEVNSFTFSIVNYCKLSEYRLVQVIEKLWWFTKVHGIYSGLAFSPFRANRGKF